MNWLKKHSKTIFQMYWKLRFVNRNNKPFFWSRGSTVGLVLTTRCNLHCKICQMFIPNGKYPKYDECSFEEWKKFFEDFDKCEWIEEVSVTGGETTLHPDLSKIVNYLIDTGRHVCLMTNLKRPEEILKIKKSWRLYVLAAYHETDDLKRFDKAYNLIKDHLRVEVIEFTEKRLLPYSRLRETMSRECLLDLPALNFAPNSPRTKRMYTSCYNTFLDGTKAVCPNCGGTNLDGNYCRTCSYRM